MQNIREPTHAGAWYTDNSIKLNKQLQHWFDDAISDGIHNNSRSKVIIAPHAGLSFSGRTAAYAYSATNISQYKRIIILGPSHHVYLKSCALSPFDAYDTPLGTLSIDKEINDELSSTKAFKRMSKVTDEDEHSFEMHTPFIKKLANEHDIKIVPILVGNISHEREVEYGKYFAKYINDPETLGSRFRYTYYRPSRNEPGGRLGKFDDVDETGDSIHESISGLDHEAWDILSEALKDPKQTHESFTKYLSETGNTICGRHAFGILLGALHHANRDYTSGSVKWTHYTQSSKALLPTDSSVSYSAGYMTM
ncbi:UPF0103-domain-containing protein [Wallemia mellicola]|uniref:UPF0103-domain-containing protein n=1 Tax=Wallemia mellicola TaxID=1708541 RepID=A0AB74KH11_9BASI|nr:UPF0103-domain-containing protein [Wallemia mellicola]TIC43157.1 UPF0103-domain-containing protein [Wallemia mellicola]TIC69945.1 UPF0103-domain-containing protein [Wallemia mellicola]